MKKIVSILFLLLLVGSLNVSAQQPADKASERVVMLSRAVKSLGRYAVRFEVAVGEQRVSGDYIVGEGRYTLHLGTIEVYGDAECRYEVDTSRKEIIIDKVDNTSHNILNNPLLAFDFIGEEYAATILSEDGGKVVVRLTPRQEAEQSGVVDVEIDTRTNLPKSLIYRPSGESIKIDIPYIEAVSVEPTAFDGSKYKNFEVIDFR
jgi:hypothetical protein